MYIYICIYMYIYNMYIYVYIYIYNMYIYMSQVILTKDNLIVSKVGASVVSESIPLHEIERVEVDVTVEDAVGGRKKF